VTPGSFITGSASILDQADISTTQILPPSCPPDGDCLFHDLRRADPAFPLGPSGNPPILLTGPNFGCGPSREDAVLALLRSGIRCLIGPGFADIFAGCARQRWLPAIDLPWADYTALRRDVLEGAHVSVDLEHEQIATGTHVYRIRIDRFTKRCLREGLSDLARTDDDAIADAIDRFEGGDMKRRPWATLT
jgi:3-isopropylmalate/(R)-2-methylmalate dehydratase small subunit